MERHLGDVKLRVKRCSTPYRTSWKTPRRRKTALTVIKRCSSPNRTSWKTPRRRKTALTVIKRCSSPYRTSWMTPRRRKTASTHPKEVLSNYFYIVHITMPEVRYRLFSIENKIDKKRLVQRPIRLYCVGLYYQSVLSSM